MATAGYWYLFKSLKTIFKGQRETPFPQGRGLSFGLEGLEKC